nr:MAG TPA_asm: Proprotein convertase subtilisin/kexin type 9 convertase, subtilisin, HYDROLASE.4A [Caudoviricetes sp.]
MLRDGRRFRIAVSECNPFTTCAFESRRVRDFASWGEYLDWLRAEYDDGTIRWEDE